MKLVLLSGGSGKRLWPLSNENRSKQFLKMINNDKGLLESMVQRVWRQLGKANLQSSAYVATNSAQFEVLRSQLGDHVPVILEPERRDTYPSILLSASYLHSVENVPLDEVIVVLPVDPYVEDPFYEHLKKLETILRDSDADIALMGVEPTYPSEKYGYIVPASPSVAPGVGSSQLWHKVKRFCEKPLERQAEELIKQSALWNCGVFGLRLGTLIRHLQDRGLPTRYSELADRYEQLPVISFDRAVVEHSPQVVAFPYDGFWKDLGTWNTFTEEMPTRVIGQGIVSEDCDNTHLVNELDIPIVVLGLTDVVVAASPDGILVANKSSTPILKAMVQQLSHAPMYEEKGWGHYRTIDRSDTSDGRTTTTQRVHLAAGNDRNEQLPSDRHEVWTILSGNGALVSEDQIRSVGAGQVVVIQAGCTYHLLAYNAMDLVVVQTGDKFQDEPIRVRYKPAEALL